MPLPKHALVTGDHGFLGRHFTRELMKRGYDVLGVDIHAEYEKDDLDANEFFAVHKELTGLPQHFDLVVHAAAREPHRAAIDKSPANALYNSALDAAMFRWAVETKQRHVLFISSSAVYSDDLAERFYATPFKEKFGRDDEPFDSYGLTKRHGEDLAHIAVECGVPVTIVRPFSGYGSDQSTNFPFGAFVKRTVDGDDPFIIWGNAHQVRDFVHVDDIVRGSLALVDEGVVDDPVNICTGRGVTMQDLANSMVLAWRKLQPEAERRAVQVDENAPMGVMYRVGDPTKLKQWYTPMIDLEEGVLRALREHK